MDRDLGKFQLSNPATPQKACTVCGGTIVWRRWRDSNWDRVMYCSASCRRISVVGREPDSTPNQKATIARCRVVGHGRVKVYALARFDFCVVGTLT